MMFRIVVVIIIVTARAAFAAPSAEELFEEGDVFFKAGDYPSAISKWNKSYDLSNEPELLFNIAMAMERDGQCPDALAMFRTFIKLAPDSRDRPRAREFIRDLKAKCDVATAPREPAPVDDTVADSAADRSAVEPARDTRPSGLEVAGLAITGAGIVSLATGIYFGYRAASIRDEVTSACRASACDWSVLGDKDAEGRRAEAMQYVFVGIGTTAIVGGGVMYLLGRSHEQPPMAISSGRNGAVVTWSGSW